MTSPRPIVTTENSELTDPRLFDAFLESIWPGDQFAQTRKRIVGTVPHAGLTFDKLEVALDEHLRINGTPNERERFEEHRKQTQCGRNAYRPELRPNWKAVYWPNPTHPQGRPLFGELAYAVKTSLITKTTPIGSAGSCFATEIKQYLTQKNYHYVETEPNHYASANWGLQYNALAFSQMVEWCFGKRERPTLVWESTENGQLKFADAFREGVYYDHLDDIAPALEKHRIEARRAFETSKVFILTVGLIEAWRLAWNDTVLARYPRQMEASLIKSEVLTVEQNVQALERALAILLEHNPTIKMIVTVSPVPLYATFQGDKRHVVVATQNAKSVLNVAVHEFANNHPEHVIYFPAYETVMWCTENPWDDDRRHVSREAVGNVMRLFEEMLILPNER